jgi:hypothetical protein
VQVIGKGIKFLYKKLSIIKFNPHLSSDNFIFKRLKYFLSNKMGDCCYFDTQILINPNSSCTGKFVQLPEIYSFLAFQSSCQDCNCDKDLKIYVNRKQDLGITLLNDYGEKICMFVVPINQYKVVDLSGTVFPEIISELYSEYENWKILTINVNNLALMSEYSSFVEKAHLYNCCQSTCKDEYCEKICNILTQVNDIEINLNDNTDYPLSKILASQLYSLTNDYIKSKIYVLNALCQNCAPIGNE